MRSEIEQRVLAHLSLIYPDHDCEAICDAICGTFWPNDCQPTAYQRNPNENLWGERDAILITYADTVNGLGEPPLQVLKRFLIEKVGQTASCVHVLPFFPYTSDDGFAVQNYTRVNGAMGTWDDISAISDDYLVMADLVLNHTSASSEWFLQYQRGEKPGVDYFVEADPSENLSDVVRPRPSPLLRKTETANGTRHVWCTFGHDQIDLNFQNPDVLIEFVRILRLYIDKGIRVIRMDAVAFLWKVAGTSCIHLEQTHEIIRLFRTLIDFNSDPIVLITETNVPNYENLTYFGNQNEAHAIYNFSLPPLVLHTLLNGNASRLSNWLMSMPPALPGCTYINFIASHDGIGLRPCEGILEPSEVSDLISAVEDFGGTVSMRRDRTGLNQAYELNISLFDALAGTRDGEDAHQNARFLASQVIMMSLAGVPAFYIHSLLASHNDVEALNRTQHNRAINRSKWEWHTLEKALSDDTSAHHIVFHELTRLIKLRSSQPAFHPNADQYVLRLDDSFFGLWRKSEDNSQSIFAIINIANAPRFLPLVEITLNSQERWTDLISGSTIDDVRGMIEFRPYQCMWLTNKAGSHSE